jgi:glycosyltransferase involved in cell wall biosynthesis
MRPIAAPGTGLRLSLDYPLPSEVAVGAGTTVFVAGSCFCPDADIRRLELLVDGEPQPLMAWSMPRSDVMHALEDSGVPAARSFRSGFWGFARLAPDDRSGYALAVRAELRDGQRLEADVATIRASPTPPPRLAPTPERSGDGPLVAIAMATFNPPPELLERQLDSIRQQTHRNWVCVISDDCSEPESFTALEAAVGDDPRFAISRSPRRLRFYNNFERALTLVPTDAEFVAMADQDDRWYPDKLETLLAAIGDAQLAFSDARIVDEAGTEVSNTYWSIRQPNHDSLPSLMFANSVTGAASLFRRDLLDLALPFPPRQFSHFHDHWLAVLARATGKIAFVERPLYDYVQHGTAVIGHAGANWMPPLRQRLNWLRKDPRERVRNWRLHYYADCCRLMQFTTTIEMRCGNQVPATSRRQMRRFAKADHSLFALADLGWRGARELLGESRTLGAEVALFFAFLWRRMLTLTSRGISAPRKHLRLDAQPPLSLLPTPGRRDPNNAAVKTLMEKIAPLELAIADDAPERVNLLIPTIDLAHFFGGYIAKMNLALRLAQRGTRVRIITVDPVPALPDDWRQRLEAYSGLAGLFDQVDVVFGREAAEIEVSRTDRFIATTWWTAHIAHQAATTLSGDPFLYLIQEYEPFTFPMGSYAALADDSYRLNHRALFSSELLRDSFRRHARGVFAEGSDTGNARSASFQNAITAVTPPTRAELDRPGPRRLLFYARPEPHAARNMFELGVLALMRAVELGAFRGEWQLQGIGAVAAHERIELGGGMALDLLPRHAQGAYGDVLRQHDVGLALMYTPHPSLVPIEMASA